MLDRTAAPLIKDAIDFDYQLMDINSLSGDNRIPIHTLRAGSQPVVQIDWVFEGGLRLETQKATARAVGGLLKNGTAHKTSVEINNAIEFYGATLTVSTSNDYSVVSLYTLTRHLHHLLPVVREVITEAAFAESELAIYQQNATQTLNIRLKNCDFVANRLIEEQVWGSDYPYGRYSNLVDIDALNTTALRAYHKRIFRHNNCRIFVAGLYEPSTIGLIEEHFTKDLWNASNEELKCTASIQPAASKKLFYENDPNGVQGAIRLCQPFIKRTHPDFVPFQILNTVLGGYFGSRLMKNIREDKGYTYGIFSFTGAYKMNSMNMISSEVGREHIEKTLKEIHYELQRLRENPIPDSELLLVKNYLLGGLLGDLEGPFSLIKFWKTLLLNGMTKQDFNKNVSIYKTIDSQSLQALAQKYLNPENFYEVVVI